MRITTLFLISLICTCSPASAEDLVSLRPYARQISFTGFTRPVQELTIAAEVSGKYTAVLVDVGDTVGDDGVVAEIDATFVLLELEKNKIAQKQTETQLVLANKTLARFKNLIDKKSTPQATYDDAVLSAEILEFSLKSLRNEERRLRELIKRHTIHAPVGWSVIERNVEPGEYIRQGEPLFRLGDFQTLLVPFLFTYEELSLLQNMKGLTLYFPDLDTEVKAEIFRVAPDFDENRRKISVDLTVAKMAMDSGAVLRGGLRARLRIEGKTEQNSYRVPLSALISRYEAHWLLAPDGTQQKVILLGTTEDGRDAIVNGGDLRPEDLFIADPAATAKDSP
ncbi:MAG: efflux RND transporter periplasmic adaptor subunit [Desulforhopalus sp.]